MSFQYVFHWLPLSVVVTTLGGVNHDSSCNDYALGRDDDDPVFVDETSDQVDETSGEVVDTSDLSDDGSDGVVDTSGKVVETSDQGDEGSDQGDDDPV